MNRRRSVLSSITGLATAVAVLFGMSAPAFGATSVGGLGNGLRVSPVHTDLTITPGSSKTVDVYITNVTEQTTTFQVTINDFQASGDESGNPALLLNENQSSPAHSLRQFVPKLTDVTLKPNQQQDIKVPISIPANAPAGGYFGAVRFAASNTTSGNQNVSLSASVASLILVKVPGNYKEVMSIASLDTRTKDKIHSIFTSNKDINGVVRFQNSGDIQEVPFGKMTVTNFRGKTVYTTEVNNGEAAGNVLPGSIRKFSVPLKNVSSFGRYTLRGDFGYGKGQTVTATTNFYVIPIPVLIAVVLLILLVVVAIIEIPRMLKRYNRRILRRAGK
jgi:hypothetical protein